MLSGNIDFSRLGMKNLSFHQNKRLLWWFSLQPSLYSYTILSAMASLTDQVNQELEVSQLIGQHEVHPPSLLARGWCWCPCPWWCAGSLHRSSLLSLKKTRIEWKPTSRREKVGLTLDHPLQVELELDLLAGVDDEGELEEDGEEEAQPCQRPKRPHQNFTLNPTNALEASENQTFKFYNWPAITESQEN